jgi:hypothetical protein
MHVTGRDNRVKKLLFVVLAVVIVSGVVVAGSGQHGHFEGYPIVKVLLNGEEVVSDVPAVNFHGRTMVPLRFVSEIMGYEIQWDNETWTASIRSMTLEELSRAVVEWFELHDGIIKDIAALSPNTARREQEVFLEECIRWFEYHQAEVFSWLVRFDAWDLTVHDPGLTYPQDTRLLPGMTMILVNYSQAMVHAMNYAANPADTTARLRYERARDEALAMCWWP